MADGADFTTQGFVLPDFMVDLDAMVTLSMATTTEVLPIAEGAGDIITTIPLHVPPALAH